MSRVATFRRIGALAALALTFVAVAPAGVASAGSPAASPTIAIVVDPTRQKPTTGCKFVRFSVVVSGLVAGERYSLSSRIERKTTVVDARLRHGPLVNGTNSVQAFVCASTVPAGPYSAYAAVVHDGAKVARATPRPFALVVRPKHVITDVGGTIGKDAFVAGYSAPTIDLRGRTLTVLLKPTGESEYRVIGTTVVAPTGRFTFVSPKLAAGWVYLRSAPTTYLLPSTDVLFKITVEPS
ncbi:hypothetical protein CCO02nite_28800 [Cellulomonas composti]|uniref:Uncharacterized protein n=1 Tax=Cellulomonas composti TaxID=266130 RepID=A0A511JE36_9CELL|nr:hypothetical protein CCO02nite_28800 [Cellulomonas composti]